MLGRLRKSEKEYLNWLIEKRCQELQGLLLNIANEVAVHRAQNKRYAIMFCYHLDLCDIPAATATRYVNQTNVFQKMFSKISKDVKVEPKEELVFGIDRQTHLMIYIS